jgi:hypothetical protein
MTKVIKFPPSAVCPLCGIQLRRTTSHEIEKGLRDPNPVIRQAFAHAVQGDTERKFTVENNFTFCMEDETPTASWLLICDSCGHKSVHIREE